MRDPVPPEYFDGHEPGLLPRLAKYQGGTFLDVGAGVGKYSLQLAHRFDRVIAVEPHPCHVDKLRRNVSKFEIKNVRVLPLAFGDTKAFASLIPLNGSSRIRQEFDDSGRREPEYRARAELFGDHLVWVTMADALLPVDPEVSLVKIDVEGSEARVLRGMQDLLVDHRPAIWIEMHDNLYGREIQFEVMVELEDAGYSWSEEYRYETAAGISRYWLCTGGDR